MFLENYLSINKLNLLYSVYKKNYIENINYNNFIKVYNIFKKHNFYFIDDIILNYLEIFEYDYNYVDEKLLSLKKQLGDNFVYTIGNDMRFLDSIIK